MKPVSGYLSSDGKFYETQEECTKQEELLLMLERIEPVAKALYGNTDNPYKFTDKTTFVGALGDAVRRGLVIIPEHESTVEG